MQWAGGWLDDISSRLVSSDLDRYNHACFLGVVLARKKGSDEAGGWMRWMELNLTGGEGSDGPDPFLERGHGTARRAHNPIINLLRFSSFFFLRGERFLY